MGIFHMEALAIGIAAGDALEHLVAELLIFRFGNLFQLLGRFRRPQFLLPLRAQVLATQSILLRSEFLTVSLYVRAARFVFRNLVDRAMSGRMSRMSSRMDRAVSAYSV